jgi:hypothetical protein
MLCVMLSAAPGCEGLLIDYEDQVLPLLATHDGRVVQRLRATEPGVAPYEVHVLEFASDAALDRYMQDPRRAALAELRDRAIASTQVLRVETVPPGD